MHDETDKLGLVLARTATLEADCTRRQVGAVIISPTGTMVSVGWNAGTAGKSCTKGHCPRAKSDVAPGTSYDTGPGACIAVHAEQRAIIRIGWADMVGTTMYVTDEPCAACWRMIEATPIVRVVWPERAITLRKDNL